MHLKRENKAVVETEAGAASLIISAAGPDSFPRTAALSEIAFLGAKQCGQIESAELLWLNSRAWRSRAPVPDARS